MSRSSPLAERVASRLPEKKSDGNGKARTALRAFGSFGILADRQGVTLRKTRHPPDFVFVSNSANARHSKGWNSKVCENCLRYRVPVL